MRNPKTGKWEDLSPPSFEAYGGELRTQGPDEPPRILRYIALGRGKRTWWCPDQTQDYDPELQYPFRQAVNLYDVTALPASLLERVLFQSRTSDPLPAGIPFFGFGNDIRGDDESSQLFTGPSGQVFLRGVNDVETSTAPNPGDLPWTRYVDRRDQVDIYQVKTQGGGTRASAENLWGE